MRCNSSFANDVGRKSVVYSFVRLWKIFRTECFRATISTNRIGDGRFEYSGMKKREGERNKRERKEMHSAFCPRNMRPYFSVNLAASMLYEYSVLRRP